MNYAVVQRLRLIDFLLATYGYVGRPTLVAYFGISTPCAANDFKLYKDRAPDNVIYNGSLKRYERSESFKPLFNCSSPEVIE